MHMANVSLALNFTNRIPVDPFWIDIKHWLPMLSKLPTAKAHVPWLLSDEEKAAVGLTDEVYPSRPLVEQDSWKPHYNRKDGERSKVSSGSYEISEPHLINRTDAWQRQ